MTQDKRIVLILNKVEPGVAEENYLKNIFGAETLIFSYYVYYEDKPVDAVLNLIKKVEREYETKVVAIEVDRLYGVLFALRFSHFQSSIKFIRSVFSNGLFENYEEFVDFRYNKLTT